MIDVQKIEKRAQDAVTDLGTNGLAKAAQALGIAERDVPALIAEVRALHRLVNRVWYLAGIQGRIQRAISDAGYAPPVFPNVPTPTPFDADCGRCGGEYAERLRAEGRIGESMSFPMYVCEECGSKRCARAAWHDAPCDEGGV